MSNFAPGICLATDLDPFPLICSPTVHKRNDEYAVGLRVRVSNKTKNLHNSSRSSTDGVQLKKPLKKPCFGASGMSVLAMKRLPICSGSSSGRAEVTVYFGPSDADDKSSAGSLLRLSGRWRRRAGAGPEKLDHVQDSK